MNILNYFHIFPGRIRPRVWCLWAMPLASVLMLPFLPQGVDVFSYTKAMSNDLCCQSSVDSIFFHNQSQLSQEEKASTGPFHPLLAGADPGAVESVTSAVGERLVAHSTQQLHATAAYDRVMRELHDTLQRIVPEHELGPAPGAVHRGKAPGRCRAPCSLVYSWLNPCVPKTILFPLRTAFGFQARNSSGVRKIKFYAHMIELQLNRKLRLSCRIWVI